MTDELSDWPVSSPLPLSGETVAFTGTLASMTHRAAAELVEQQGGHFVQHVSQLTTLLVVGEEGWPLEADGQPSVKLLQAQALQEKGSPLRVLSESEWLAAVGLENRSQPQQLYTPAMLSQLLNVSVHDIRRWERLQLIHPVRRVMRLPYFDLDEVTAARKLAELLATGVSVERVSESLSRLQRVMPKLLQPLAQLPILVQGKAVLYRDAAGWLDSRTGQRRLPFLESETEAASPSDEAEAAVIPFPTAATKPFQQLTADDWFERGCHYAEEGELGYAVEALRSALVECPGNADFHFHLADVLYRQGKREAAIERYYAAVEHDHDFIEAWTQLGCVLYESAEYPAAKEAFQIALDRHPDFPDAHFHLAQLLERLGDKTAARAHWETYLSFDRQGPWAEIARQHLDAE
ncbi:tetratricopeptide repeat protein [bacterium]|nr:tetratricopeptide repeat protein [bacterium]